VGTNSVMDGDASLDPLIESELQAHRVPGCSIALVNEERVVWSAGYGTAVLRSGRPATPDSVYHLFSVTKLFTAVAVLKLVERGALGLDHVLGRYLPEEKAAQAITIEQLLSHRSGLKDTLRAFLAVRAAGEKPLTSREALSTYRLKATRRPGERVEYRNVNYALLGEVITRVSGMEYTRFVTTAILDPLGAQLSFDVTAEMRDRASTGYLHTTDPMRFLLRWLLPDQMRQLYGDRHAGFIALREFTLSTASIGGLVGSVLECAKFLRAQLAPDPRVLSEAGGRGCGGHRITSGHGARLEGGERRRPRVPESRGWRRRLHVGAAPVPGGASWHRAGDERDAHAAHHAPGSSHL
jgi:CubicO group peptidase (beta-lactamase class C family)